MSKITGISVAISSEPESVADQLEQQVKMTKKIKKSGDFQMHENKYIGMQQKINILKFLKCLNEKNYAQAHKYLKSVIEHKIMNRINKHKQVRVF